MSNTKKPLFSLDGVNFSMLLSTLGANATETPYRGKPLSEHLSFLGRRIEQVVIEMNNGWARYKSHQYRGEMYLNELLTTSTWAYAQVMDLKSIIRPLGDSFFVPYIGTLDRLCVTCLITVHTYGNPDQKMIALRGLLTEFLCNGGIDQIGFMGCGALHTINQYCKIHFGILAPSPVVAQAFIILVCSLADEIRSNHSLECLIEFDLLQRTALSELHGSYNGDGQDFDQVRASVSAYIGNLREQAR